MLEWDFFSAPQIYAGGAAQKPLLLDYLNRLQRGKKTPQGFQDTQLQRSVIELASLTGAFEAHIEDAAVLAYIYEIDIPPVLRQVSPDGLKESAQRLYGGFHGETGVERVASSRMSFSAISW